MSKTREDNKLLKENTEREEEIKIARAHKAGMTGTTLGVLLRTPELSPRGLACIFFFLQILPN